MTVRRRTQAGVPLLVAAAVGASGMPVVAAAQDQGAALSASALGLLGMNAAGVDLAAATQDPALAPDGTPAEAAAEDEQTTIILEEEPETSTITVEPESSTTGTGSETSTITTAPESSGAPPATADTEDVGEITVEGVWVPLEVGPQRGLRLSRDQLPANVQSATGEEIRESRATSLTDFMNQNMQSVMINDYQGNPFQADLQFRGFTASPQIGTPQGLSVFVDGIRVNEPFGDVVNWDLIPLNAIGTFDVFPGSNPLFGLNTLGGALSIRTKNGFDDAGVHTSLQGGSWGRIHGQLEGGGHHGPIGGFAAVTGFHEQGWRDNSPSDVKQAFTKASVRAGPVELDATMLLAGNDLVGNGLLPLDLYEDDPAAVFTSPDETRNSLQQFSLSGLFNVTDTFNVTAQAYRRKSDRRASGGDIYEEFSEMSPRVDALVEARQPAGFPICAFADTNQDNIADYWLDNNADLDGDGFGDADEIYDPAIDGPINPVGLTTAQIINDVQFLQPLDNLCTNLEYSAIKDARNRQLSRDGRAGVPSGIVEGTPIGVVTNTNIDQITEGAALQFNFNLEKHRFMVGASVDANRSEYLGFQRLALIDESHNVFLAPEEIDPLYLAAREPVINNQFDGFQNTHSAYFSETYSPFDNLHMTVAGRYNYTRTKNNLSSRQNASRGTLHGFRDFDTARPDAYSCDSFLIPGDATSGIDPASCSADPDIHVNSSVQKIINDPQNLDERNRRRLAGETEKYIYTSFNPSVGINFLPVPETNIFWNWSQGTRAPSVVELGCAYDGTLIDVDGNGELDLPRSIANPNACTLPSTLSGDPFLPQVFARSMEFGLRGTLPNGWEWNGSVYRTNLYDDLYFVGGSRGQGNFQNIGDTVRQGFEMGLSGEINRWFEFNLNYGLTEAMFNSQLYILSDHNSSRLAEGPLGGDTNEYRPEFFDPTTGKALVQIEDMIDVQPGDRLPGVPLHNVNATLTVHPTEKWDLSLNMVAHSSSFMRGNENNDHRAGTLIYVDQEFPGAPTEIREVYRFDGEVPGYALFNLKTSYEVGKGFTLFGQVNNLLDKAYFSAGRLGVNPFAPSTEGAIGPSGWNYNSLEWVKSSFVAPGSPRAYWMGLEYQF